MRCFSSRLLGAVLAAGLLFGCGGDEDPPEVSCADSAALIAFPSPLWFDGSMLTAPKGDLGFSVIEEERPEWIEQVSELDGWPRMPDLIIPLSAAPSAVSAERVAAFVPSGESWVEQEVGFEARMIEGAPYVLLRPLLPLGPGASEAIVVLRGSAVTGAAPLGVCQGDVAHPDYAAAAAELDGQSDVALAMKLELASTSAALPKLGGELAKSPVLTVDSVEARTLDSFGEKAPSTEVAALLAPTAASGLLALPEYRGSGMFSLDDSGVPKSQGSTKPGFVVALPAAGSAPYPFVLFQHGGGQNKADFFALAKPLVEAGFAFVAIDLPEHGDRGSPNSSDLDFLHFDDALATRENFRQTTADHMAVLTGIDALNTALSPVLGADKALDKERGFYMGLSLGGITGSLTFASAPELQGAALFVAGSSYAEIVTYGLFGVLFNDVMQREPVEAAVVLAMLQTLLGGADPASYARHVEQNDKPPRPVLFMQAVDDPIIIMSANDRLARAFGADLIEPSDHAVAGMAAVNLPGADNFAWQSGGDKATRVLIHHPMAEVPKSDRHGALIVQNYSQETVAHCFAKILETGSCEVIDSGFVSH